MISVHKARRRPARTAARSRRYAVVVVLALLAGACTDRAAQPVGFSGMTMGTAYSVKVGGLPDGLEEAALGTQIENLLARINRQMSTWDAQSELSRFNAGASTDWIDVSADLAAVVTTALHASELTAGAFDVTVAPLVDLWGFGPGKQQDRVPSDAAIAAATARIGYTRIRARGSPPAIRKDLPELHIDLSAIAKGYAVDQVATLLESLGVIDYLVEIGGELRGRGRNPVGGHWRIGIEQPSSRHRDLHAVISVDDSGIATSGDYRNYFEKDGVRYSHTIDPRSGRPIAHRLASVTVIDDSTAAADALATGLLVLGPEEGFRLAERAGVAAWFIIRTDDGFIDRQTPAFEQHRSGRRS